MKRTWLIALLAAGAVTEQGCLFKKKEAKVEPPVIAAPPSTRTAPPETPSVPPPPTIDASKSTTANAPTPTIETPVPDRPPRKVDRQPKKTRRASTPVPKSAGSASHPPPVETVEVETPSSVPTLAQLLSPAEQQAYNTAIDTALRSARAKLSTVQTRRLNDSQRSSLERATAFVKQAEEARPTDLATAKALAERADVLAEDLLRATR
ncbi:MAG: hypothetical protein R2729_16010 [Bryobacteraceae bacterium]